MQKLYSQPKESWTKQDIMPSTIMTKQDIMPRDRSGTEILWTKASVFI